MFELVLDAFRWLIAFLRSGNTLGLEIIADGLSRAKCPFGGMPVPILPLVYRKVALWGSGGRAKPYPERVLDSLFWNTAGRIWLTKKSDPQDVTDLFHLVTVPWFKTQSLGIEWFERNGDDVTIGLEKNCTIHLNPEKETYSVHLNGYEAARNGSTFCPLDEGRIAFYSLNPLELSADLPDSWEAANLAAIILDAEKPQECGARVEEDRIIVSVPARRPVIVYRDGASAKKRLLQTG
jgi:hypothetical protein